MTQHEPICILWDQLNQEKVREGVSRSAFGNDNVLIVRNVLQPGMDLNPHTHEFDQIALIIDGHARMNLDGEDYDMPAGSAVLIPAGVIHYAEPVGDDPVINIDVFAPPRSDFSHLTEWMPTK